MPAAATVTRPREPVAGNLTMTGVLRSEWTKFRSVRSTWWLLSTTVILMVGVAVFVSPGGASGKPASPAAFARNTEYGSVLSQLALLVLGVMVFTGEYHGGMIRASLSVVPRRLLLLWGKLGAFGAVVLVLSLASSVAAFVLGGLAHQPHDGRAHVWFGDPQVTRIVIGAGLVLGVTGIFGLAIGAIVRNTAAGLSTIAAIFFVLPLLLRLALPSSDQGFLRLMPSNAGGALWNAALSPTSLSPWTGFALLCGYTAALVAVAAWRLRRGDA
jgi:ABC-type transport system involved in multi-copper enzyme maturation permease subunit